MSTALPTNLVPTTLPGGSVKTVTADPTLSNPSGSNPWWNTDAPTLPAPSYTDPAPTSGSTSGSFLSTGALIGIIAAGAALAILLIAGIVWLLLRRKARRQQRANTFSKTGKGHKKHHSLGSRSSFGFTIRPGAIPPSLRAPYNLDPVPPTSSSLAAAWGMRMTPTPTPTTGSSFGGNTPGLPETPGASNFTHGSEQPSGDSVLDRLFTARSPSARSRTEDSHATTTSDTPPLPTPTFRPMPAMREVSERPLTGSTTEAGSTRPLVATLHHPSGQRRPSQDGISEKSAQTFYTVRSDPASSVLLPENASGVSLAPLGPTLPSFPVPPRIEEASDSERDTYQRRLSERLSKREEERRSRTSQGRVLGAEGQRFYRLPGESAASLEGAPHAPTPSSPGMDSEPLSDVTSAQPEQEFQAGEDVYGGMGGMGQGLATAQSLAQSSRLSVPPQIVAGDAPMGPRGAHEWVADLDVRRPPMTRPAGAVGTGDPFVSADEVSLRDLEMEVSGSTSGAGESDLGQLLPPHRGLGGWAREGSLREGSIRDDGASERYREVEHSRSVAALLEALEASTPGVGERVRSVVESDAGGSSVVSSLSKATGWDASLSSAAGPGGLGKGRGRPALGESSFSAMSADLSAISGPSQPPGHESISLAYAREPSRRVNPDPLQEQYDLEAEDDADADPADLPHPPPLRRIRERRSALDVAKSFRGAPAPVATPAAIAAPAAPPAQFSGDGTRRLRKTSRPRR